MVGRVGCVEERDVRILKAIAKDPLAVEKSPDTSWSTPWLFRLQAYWIEYILDEMQREMR